MVERMSDSPGLENLLKSHHSLRNDMIEKEKRKRHDYNFRQNLTPTARKACSIVKQIREHELETRWNSACEDTSNELYPGMMFSKARERMESTTLWKIVRRMPKGTLLHAHFDAMVDMPWLLSTAFETEGVHITSDIPLDSSEALKKAAILFEYSSKVTTSSWDIFTSTYVPRTPVPLAYAAASFPSGQPGFMDYLISRITITIEESFERDVSVDGIWKKFDSIFPILNGLVFFEPIFRIMMRRTMEHLLLDGIKYLDLRIPFVVPFTLASGALGSNLDLVRVFYETVTAFRETPEGSDFWGARVIWTATRIMSQNQIESNMLECMDAKRAYPSAISGYDLVGQEGKGRTLLEHLPSLLWFRSECIKRSLEIPFFFHAGEVLGDGDPHDCNLFDAILLETKRIGHGFSLYKHPSLIAEVKERGICLEVCPISNEVLRLTSSISTHPLPAMLAHGVSVALANDDPGILGQGATGMSHDFWQVLQAFENVGLEGLGDLAETSIWFAAFDDGVGGEEPIGIDKGSPDGWRHQRVAEWRADWEDFCKWIVQEFANAYPN